MNIIILIALFLGILYLAYRPERFDKAMRNVGILAYIVLFVYLATIIIAH